MALYTYDFCHDLLYGGWDSGIINNLEDAKREIKQNFEDMDLENASVQEEMRQIIDEMIAELDQLISTIKSVNFR
ncbi:hypothetical protein [Metabacillus niabensis]|uniref:Uncharacterized protein n=1 Tax=Metabacillus niabensis TaxID=324854 RepID=A0ABT9Z5S6_9BACI|nr:hypothetical protein [Metabacillus niabensis]MDQ0227329.1 hypothetical protein [Metabacillus niabensis]PAD66194.1 hypothetical protein CHH83_25245 [Bacillus sp. 7586-K]